jgi:hypothetical protein
MSKTIDEQVQELQALLAQVQQQQQDDSKEEKK